jgi:hypothetical protein
MPEYSNALAIPQTSADTQITLPVPGFFGPMSYDAFDAAIQKAEGWRGPGDVSTAGAKGRYQVIRSTALNPGPGMTGMSAYDFDNNNYGELDRVGKAYGKSMWDKYSVDGRPYPALAAAAYNWGPGHVDELLKTFGDPRTGKVSWPDFISRMPQETRDYVYGKGKAPPPTTVATTSSNAPSPNAPSITAPLVMPSKPGDLRPMQPPTPPAPPTDFRAMMMQTMLQSLLAKGFQFQPVEYDPKIIVRGYRENQPPMRGPEMGTIGRAPQLDVPQAKPAYSPFTVPNPLGRPRGG